MPVGVYQSKLIATLLRPVEQQRFRSCPNGFSRAASTCRSKRVRQSGSPRPEARRRCCAFVRDPPGHYRPATRAAEAGRCRVGGCFSGPGKPARVRHYVAEQSVTVMVTACLKHSTDSTCAQFAAKSSPYSCPHIRGTEWKAMQLPTRNIRLSKSLKPMVHEPAETLWKGVVAERVSYSVSSSKPQRGPFNCCATTSWRESSSCKLRQDLLTSSPERWVQRWVDREGFR